MMKGEKRLQILIVYSDASSHFEISNTTVWGLGSIVSVQTG